MLNLHNLTTKRYVCFVKRTIDVCMGAAGTIAFGVVYPLIAIMIKSDSQGSVLYKQTRSGIDRRKLTTHHVLDRDQRCRDQGGKPFQLIKFRTMFEEAEKGGPQLSNPEQDPRITRIGKWLRKLHVDEVPQFWNVLKGDMSLVGPRPERPHFIEVFRKDVPQFGSRTKGLRPGLTGLAQLEVGYNTDLNSIVLKCHFDNLYVASMSDFSAWMLLEAKILMRTPWYLIMCLFSDKSLRKNRNTRRMESLQNEIGGMPLSLAAYISFEGGLKRLVVRGLPPSEFGERLNDIDFLSVRRLDLAVSVSNKLRLDDISLILNLFRKASNAGAKVSISGENVDLSRALRELKLDSVMSLQPDRRPVTNLLTVDVECWFHAHNLREKVPKSIWHLQYSRVGKNVERILEVLKSHKAKGTFFVLGWIADSFPEIVQMIDREGHEIGTHGYSHNLAYEMTPVEFEYDLAKSIEAIAKCSTGPVCSHRAASFSIVENSLWVFEILRKYGIENDSSVFPIRRKRYGIPKYPILTPHTVQDERGRLVDEFPMSVISLGGKQIPACGGGYLRLYPFRITAQFIRHLNEREIPAVVYFHPWEIDVDQQRVKASPLKRFQHYVNLETTEWKICMLLQMFSFGSVESIKETPCVLRSIRSQVVRIMACSERQTHHLPIAVPNSKLVRVLV